MLMLTFMGAHVRASLGVGAAVALAVALGTFLPEAYWLAALLATLFALALAGGITSGAGGLCALNEGVIFWKMGQVLARRDPDPSEGPRALLQQEGSLEECQRDAPAGAHRANSPQVGLYALGGGGALALPWVLLY